MKKLNCVSEFNDQRDRELYANFCAVLREPNSLSLREMFAEAAKRPASRFWVSTERAAIVLSDMIHGRHPEKIARMIPMRRAMYDELLGRVKRLMTEEPEICLAHAVERVVLQPAPCFYLTDEGSRIIIYRYRRRQRAKMKLNNLLNAKSVVHNELS